MAPDRENTALRICLVEDDGLVRDTLIMVLEDEGMLVSALTSGEAALAFLQGAPDPPDLVVSDVNLGPGIDGVELLTALRQIWPDLPAVLISGRPAPSHNLGARGRFVPKPFALQDLMDAVR